MLELMVRIRISVFLTVGLNREIPFHHTFSLYLINGEALNRCLLENGRLGKILFPKMFLGGWNEGLIKLTLLKEVVVSI